MKEIVKELPARRNKLNFEEMGIPKGSILDCPKYNKTAEVISPKKVLYEGRETSLSPVIEELTGYKKASFSSFAIWYYKGVPLTEML
ncbi:MAG: hypothetical protein WA584_01130 [Pyrinomonadaceae bacterium]